MTLSALTQEHASKSARERPVETLDATHPLKSEAGSGKSAHDVDRHGVREFVDFINAKWVA